MFLCIPRNTFQINPLSVSPLKGKDEASLTGAALSQRLLTRGHIVCNYGNAETSCWLSKLLRKDGGAVGVCLSV